MDTRSTSMASDTSEREIPSSTPRSDPGSPVQDSYLVAVQASQLTQNVVDIMTQSIYLPQDNNNLDSMEETTNLLTDRSTFSTEESSAVETQILESEASDNVSLSSKESSTIAISETKNEVSIQNTMKTETKKITEDSSCDSAHSSTLEYSISTENKVEAKMDIAVIEGVSEQNVITTENISTFSTSTVQASEKKSEIVEKSVIETKISTSITSSIKHSEDKTEIENVGPNETKMKEEVSDVVQNETAKIECKTEMTEKSVDKSSPDTENKSSCNETDETKDKDTIDETQIEHSSESNKEEKSVYSAVTTETKEEIVFEENIQKIQFEEVTETEVVMEQKADIKQVSEVKIEESNITENQTTIETDHQEKETKLPEESSSKLEDLPDSEIQDKKESTQEASPDKVDEMQNEVEFQANLDSGDQIPSEADSILKEKADLADRIESPEADGEVKDVTSRNEDEQKSP